MVDNQFILSNLQKLTELKQTANESFANLTSEQFNYKLQPEQWSVAQCLDHLVVSDLLYFPVLKNITSGNYQMTKWEKWNPLNFLIGKMLVTGMQEQVRKKFKSPKIFLPDTKTIDTGIYERYDKHLDTLMGYISSAQSLDIDKIKITSPASPVITLSLRHAFLLLVQHQGRHINQALKLKKQRSFPN